MPRRHQRGGIVGQRDKLQHNKMKKQLTIYYTSDVHGYFSPIDYASGNEIPSGLANCISNFEKDGNTLIIDGGDILQGSPFTYYLYNKRKDDGCLPAEIMNIGGYDFVTLGNHDFNYGKEELEKYEIQLEKQQEEIESAEQTVTFEEYQSGNWKIKKEELQKQFEKIEEEYQEQCLIWYEKWQEYEEAFLDYV